MVTSSKATIAQLPTNQKNCFKLDFPSKETADAFEVDRTKLGNWALLAHERGFERMGMSVCGVNKCDWLTRSVFQLLDLDIEEKPSQPKPELSTVIQFPASSKRCFALDFPTKEAARAFEEKPSKRLIIAARDRGYKKIALTVCGEAHQSYHTCGFLQRLGIEEKPSEIAQSAVTTTRRRKI